jgi:hypothetical protein
MTKRVPGAVMGRPRIPDETWESVITQIEGGAFYRQACADHNVDMSGLFALARERPEVRARLDAANEAKAHASAEGAMAMAEELSTYWRNNDARAEQSAAVAVAIKSAQWDAERRDPKRWGAKQAIEHSGEVGTPTRVDVSNLTLEQKEAMAKLLKKA